MTKISYSTEIESVEENVDSFMQQNEHEIHVGRDNIIEHGRLVAYDENEDYRYRVVNNKTIEITKYIGNSDSVVIPTTIENLPVVDIGDAFTGNNIIKSVIIPNIKEEIGYFSNCTNLTSVVILEGSTKINSRAFQNCTNLKDIEIPNSIKIIGSEAFDGCSNLNNVKLPNDITKIEDKAFNNCVNLQKIKMPDSIQEIGKYVFSNTGFTEIKIPSQMKTIGYGMFAYCNNLTNVTIPNNIDTIGSSAFFECEKVV